MAQGWTDFVGGMKARGRTLLALLPLFVTGTIMLVVSVAFDGWALAHMCTPGDTRSVGCQIVYEYGFRQGWIRNGGALLIGVPLLIAAFVATLKKELAELMGEAVRNNPSSFEHVCGQIESAGLGASQIDRLLEGIALYHDGTRHELRGDFGRHFSALLTALEREGAHAYRQAYSEQFRLSHSSFRPDTYFSFIQVVSYQIGGSSAGVYPFHGYTAVAAAAAELDEVLANWEFVVDLGQHRFDLKTYLPSIDVAKLRAHVTQRSGPVEIVYDGSELKITIRQNMPVTAANRQVNRRESGLMSRSEVATTTSMGYPTKGATIVVSVPDDYEIVDQSFSPEQMQFQCAVTLSDPRDHIHMHYGGWLMQGLCSVVSWRPR